MIFEKKKSLYCFTKNLCSSNEMAFLFRWHHQALLFLAPPLIYPGAERPLLQYNQPLKDKNLKMSLQSEKNKYNFLLLLTF